MNAPYLLADDLSGALEAGASFRARGCEVGLSLTAGPNAGAVLPVITTETRNLPAVGAAQNVRAVLRRQQMAGRQLLFKKVDSTLRGPLAAEINAVMETLNPPLAVFCPANPPTGRTVADGILRVNGVPLAETDFRRDPLSPATTSRIAELLGRSTAAIGSLSLAALRSNDGANRVTAIRNSGSRFIVSDAETSEDLACLVAAARQVCPETVFIGANGLAEAVARAQFPQARRSREPLPHVAPLLVICGSRHPASHRQVEHLEATGRAKLLTLDPHAISSSAVRRDVLVGFSTHAIVAVRFNPKTDADPATLVRAVARIVAPIDAARSCAYFFTGGETAWSACRALGGDSLRVIGPWEDVVVASQLMRPGATTSTVFTKPGGYGDPELLVRLAGELVK